MGTLHGANKEGTQAGNKKEPQNSEAIAPQSATLECCMGYSESKSRSAATPLPIAVLIPTTRLFTNTRFFMAVAHIKKCFSHR
jgi:hypothetical protein